MAADYTRGGFHDCTHASGSVPEDAYQYSIYVPKDYDPRTSYPLVFFLHGGGKGRTHPNQAKWNMVAQRLKDNKRTTDAGYSRHVPDYRGYILVSPVKPIARWNAVKFARLYKHVKSKVSIDEKRVCVTGFSMGGQGTWRVACGNDGSYHIAAMMPLGAWGCNEVRRGTTRETCRTTKTAVWILHCPLDHVSKIAEQLTLFQNHLDCGGYGRFTMIPGKGHISRPRNDHEFFSMRMAWMLAQTYGTPYNYVLTVHDGAIVKARSGKRPYTGDNSRYGFYEPETVLSITAPERKGGKSFVRWASDKGRFARASSRTTTYTTVAGDADIWAFYDTGAYQLRIVGGRAAPAAPSAGQVVTVTAGSDTKEKQFAYWTAGPGAVPPALPPARSFTFVMPANEVTYTAASSKRPNPASALLTAAKQGDVKAIKRLLAFGVKVDAKDRHQVTALFVAALFGQADAAELLIDQGADIKAAKGKDGSSVLHTASFLCYTEIVKLLLDKGADINALNDRAETPLDTVAAPWSEDLGKLYTGIGKALGLHLDLKRIRATRPKIAALLRSRGGKMGPKGERAHPGR